LCHAAHERAIVGGKQQSYDPSSTIAFNILSGQLAALLFNGVCRRNLLEIQPGWSVCAEANNGQEALEKTIQYQPDVIIMDISMPVMNGLEAATRITREHPQIPVILFSLHLSDDLYRHFNTDGIRGAVAKGDAARDLVLAVQTVLAGGTFFPGKKASSN
jgi:two-component system nitrate/nitrite response regulator NarL